MDWADIAGSIGALLVFILLPLVLRKRKKEGPLKLDEFLNHLTTVGIRATMLDKDTVGEKVGARRRASGQRSEGVIRLEQRSIDYIDITSVASQYGVQYFINYLVKSPDSLTREKRKKTRMVSKKSSFFGGRVTDIEWRGDEYLSRALNFDYRLKDYLLQAGPNELKAGIWIFPEPKQEYARIRTGYVLPSAHFLEAMDIIAGHVKSGW